MDGVSKSMTHQQQAERLLLSLGDHVMKSPLGVFNMQTSIFSYRSLPPNFDKFILILSGKKKQEWLLMLPKKSQAENSLKCISLVWVEYDLTHFEINLQVKFSGTHLLGKAKSASIQQWKWQLYAHFLKWIKIMWIGNIIIYFRKRM